MIRSSLESSSRRLLQSAEGRRFIGLLTTSPRYSAADTTASFCSRSNAMRSSSSSYYDSFYHHQQHTTTTTTTKEFSSASSWMESQGWRLQVYLEESTTKEKEEWLDSMLNTNYKHVDTDSFLVVLNALAADVQNGDVEAPRRSERWMKRLKDHRFAQPTVECYQAVIQAWANSDIERVEVSVNRAERWLNEMIAESEKQKQENQDKVEQHDKEGYVLKPTIECYNAYLDACTRGRHGTNKRYQEILKKHIYKADAILRRLYSNAQHYNNIDGDDNNNNNNNKDLHPLTPNTESFNFVIRGWARIKSGDMGPKKIIQLLRLMESHQRNDPINSIVRPNTKSYAMAMDSLVSLAGRKAQKCVRDPQSKFETDISLNGLQEMTDADDILQYMHMLHDGGVDGVVPHTVAYNIMLTGYANLAKHRHNNSALRAEAIIRKMQYQKDNGFLEAAPDRISYEKVMSAWAHSGHPNSGQRATWWLKRLWNDCELEGDPRLLPTVHTYNIAIQANAYSDGPLEAENLLLDLGERYKLEQAANLRPNSESFNIVVRSFLVAALACKEQNNKKEGVEMFGRALDWLFSLKEAENEIDLATSPELYIRALKTAKKFANRDLHVFDLANRVYNDMKTSRHNLPHVMYSLMVEIAILSMSSDQHQEDQLDFLSHIFEECCDEGMLTSRLVQNLATYFENGWTEEKCRIALDTLIPQGWPLPLSWSRNLPHSSYMPSQSDLNPTKKSAQNSSSRNKKKKKKKQQRTTATTETPLELSMTQMKMKLREFY